MPRDAFGPGPLRRGTQRRCLQCSDDAASRSGAKDVLPCDGCQRDLPRDAFPPGSLQRGKRRRCLECSDDAASRSGATRRANLRQQDALCMACGELLPLSCFNVDHRQRQNKVCSSCASSPASATSVGAAGACTSLRCYGCGLSAPANAFTPTQRRQTQPRCVVCAPGPSKRARAEERASNTYAVSSLVPPKDSPIVAYVAVF